MKQLLHNIVELSAIETNSLRNITVIPGVGVRLGSNTSDRPLLLSGLAQGEVSSTIENKSRVYKTSVSARLREHFDPSGKSLVFLARCANGDRFLIGTNEKPYPMVTVTDSLPGNHSDPSGCNLTIELTDMLGLLPVLDRF